VEIIEKLNPSDGDVLVWVDGDDRLSSPNALKRLDYNYRRHNPLMSYGSYRPFPASKTCPMASPYPATCRTNREFRQIYKWGIQFNHLRTVTWDLYKHLNPEVDFKKNGKWFPVSADAAIMIPCMEMAGDRCLFIKEVLYTYSSENPISEWRKAPAATNDIHDYISKLPKKDLL
jgi:hypothetical protein